MAQPCQALRHMFILNSSTEVHEATHMTARHWSGVTPVDVLCVMIKNNSYLGAGKGFAQACCLLVSSLNVLLISTQAPYEIFGWFIFSRYPSSAFLLNWMWMPRQLYVPFLLKCSAATCQYCSLAGFIRAGNIKYTCCGHLCVFFSVFVVVETEFSDACSQWTSSSWTDLLDFQLHSALCPTA